MKKSKIFSSGVGVRGLGVGCKYQISSIGKRGAMGEGILMMYRLLLISFIALVILGTSSVFYDFYIDVRDAEAVVMTRNVVDCIAPEGVLDWDSFSKGDRKNILVYCGFDDLESERFFVKVAVHGSDRIGELSHGDSGALWVLGIFSNVESLGEGLKKYEPGYSRRIYSVGVLDEGERVDGSIEVEVLVKHEM